MLSLGRPTFKKFHLVDCGSSWIAVILPSRSTPRGLRLMDCGSSWIEAAAKGIEVPQYKPFYRSPQIIAVSSCHYPVAHLQGNRDRLSHKVEWWHSCSPFNCNLVLLTIWSILGTTNVRHLAKVTRTPNFELCRWLEYSNIFSKIYFLKECFKCLKYFKYLSLFAVI